MKSYKRLYVTVGSEHDPLSDPCQSKLRNAGFVCLFTDVIRASGLHFYMPLFPTLPARKISVLRSTSL